MFRRRRPEAPETQATAGASGEAIPERLRPMVADAVSARQRWSAVVGGLQAGPLRDRLAELGARVDAGVAEVHATAARVAEVERVLAALDPERATADYKAAKRRAVDGDPPPELPALEQRFASVQRLLNVVADADERLRVIDARLLAAVAQGAELAVTADQARMEALGADLDDVVSELASLRGAMASLD